MVQKGLNMQRRRTKRNLYRKYRKFRKKLRRRYRKVRKFLRISTRIFERNVEKVFVLLTVLLVILIKNQLSTSNAMDAEPQKEVAIHKIETNSDYEVEKISEAICSANLIETTSVVTENAVIEISAEQQETQEIEQPVTESRLMRYIKDIPLELEWYDFSYLANEKELLAKIIYQEGRGGGEKEMYCVACVILNRTRTNYRDYSGKHQVSTIHDVLYQDDIGEQYGKATKALIENWHCSEPEVYATALEIATALIDGEVPVLPEYVLYQTGHHLPNTVLVDLGGTVEYYARPKDFVY